MTIAFVCSVFKTAKRDKENRKRGRDPSKFHFVKFGPPLNERDKSGVEK